MQDLQTLASPQMEGRLTGSAGSHRAQSFIVGTFKELQVQPLQGSYAQKFSFTRNRGGTAQTFPGATNLIGWLPGTTEPDRFVLVSAHYDHLGVRNGGVYHGADDNASGVAAMLAVARGVRAHPVRQSVLFVAFDGEEEGLQGARHFVAHPLVPLNRISAVVNMDMVGRSDTNVIVVSGTHHYPALKAPVEEAAKERSITVRFGHDQPGAAGGDWTQSSDHGPFHTARVPFLYFGVEDHGDYHRPTDTADKITRAFYVEAAELVLGTVSRLAGVSQPGVIPRQAGGR